MPTIREIPKSPLTAEERPLFVGWARTRPTFRPCQNGRDVDGVAVHDKGCCISILQGTVGYGRASGTAHAGRTTRTLPDLVLRWRSLGRPEAYQRPKLQTRLRQPRPDGKGATRGRQQRRRLGLE